MGNEARCTLTLRYLITAGHGWYTKGMGPSLGALHFDAPFSVL
jgi:hypothetical protein